MKKVFALAATAVALSTSGATTWRLLNSDSGSATSVTNAYLWVSTSSNSTHSGDPGEDLSPNEIYLVRGGYVLNTLSGTAQDTVFKGKQLTLGAATNSTGRVRQRSYGAARTTWDNWGANTGLILAYGMYEAYAGDNTTSEIYGKVRVNSDASMPYIFGFSYGNTRMNWHGDFTGAADKVLRVEGVNYSSSSNPKPLVSGATLGLLGSLEGFSGTMAVSNVTVCVCDGSFPGTMSFEGGGGLSVTNSVSDTFTVGSLAMAGDVCLSVSAQLNENLNAVSANSKIVVTDSFAVSGAVAVSVNLSSGVTNMVDVPLLVVPLGATLATEQFFNETASFSIVTNDAAETLTLVAHISPVVSQTVTDNNNSTGIRDGGPSSMTNAMHWTDGKVPHAEAHYVVPTSLRLRTPLEKDIDYEFPGESLTLRGSTQLGIFNKSAYFKELRLAANSLVMLGNGVNNGTIKGHIRLLDSSSCWICAYNTARLDIAADIVGDGRIVIDGSHANTSGRRAYTKFTGDNSRFFGAITVSLNRVPETIANAKYQDLQVSDPTKLGAPLPVFNARALVLKRLGRLAAMQSITFSDTTRGLYIGIDGGNDENWATSTYGTNSEGQFSVGEGDTLTILTQLTLNGRLHKYGAGTLALGGPLKFGVGGGDEPLANSNLLAVAQGFVKPLAADSFNGLEMTFAAGTGIKLDINPQDADLRAYGLRNTKAVTPFTSANGGKIPVSFDVPAGFTPEGPFSVGIATVPAATDEEVAAAMAQFAVASPHVAHCKMTKTAVLHAEEGTVTVTASFRVHGFSFVVR